MSQFEIEETDQFLKDVEEAAVWILLSNIEQSVSFAETKANQLATDLNSLKERLKKYPESGETDDIQGLRKFPVYEGRYSAKWTINHVKKIVILVALSDSKYPRNLRQFHTEE